MPASWTTNVKTASGPPNRINGPDSSGSNDSVAQLNGTWAKTQTVTGTVFVGGTYNAAEVELFLMMQVDVPGNTIKGYECDFVSSLGANGTIFIQKWLGTQGSVTTLNGGGSGDPMVNVLADGDILKATIDASGKITITQNGTQIAQVTDGTPYTTGNPGVGFDAGTVSDGNNLGFKAYTATDVVAGVSSSLGYRSSMLAYL